MSARVLFRSLEEEEEKVIEFDRFFSLKKENECILCLFFFCSHSIEYAREIFVRKNNPIDCQCFVHFPNNWRHRAALFFPRTACRCARRRRRKYKNALFLLLTDAFFCCESAIYSSASAPSSLGEIVKIDVVFLLPHHKTLFQIPSNSGSFPDKISRVAFFCELTFSGGQFCHPFFSSDSVGYFRLDAFQFMVYVIGKPASCHAHCSLN